MKSVRSLIGLTVIRDGRRIGRVNGVKLSDDLKKMQGVWMERGCFGRRYLDGDQIELIGDVSVMIRGEGRREKASPSLLPALAVSAEGRRLGAVTDAFVDEDSLEICQVELSAGFLEDFLQGRSRISQFSARTGGEIVMGVPEEGGEEA